jgi:hypothetical protein
MAGPLQGLRLLLLSSPSVSPNLEVTTRTKNASTTFVLSDRWSRAIISDIDKILVTHTPRAVTRTNVTPMHLPVSACTAITISKPTITIFSISPLQVVMGPSSRPACVDPSQTIAARLSSDHKAWKERSMSQMNQSAGVVPQAGTAVTTRGKLRHVTNDSSSPNALLLSLYLAVSLCCGLFVCSGLAYRAAPFLYPLAESRSGTASEPSHSPFQHQSTSSCGGLSSSRSRLRLLR